MNKIVFASDFHLGMNGILSSEDRERALVRWIQEVAMEADEVFFLGDIFDFWYEYHSVIPKGFTRFLGALALLADTGKPIHIFTGNHDMWIFEYFTKEFNIPIYRRPEIFERQGKKLLIGHGDGLGPGDRTYKFIKKIFNNKICIQLFQWIHPSIGMAIAQKWSRNSRDSHVDIHRFYGPEKEHLVKYSEYKSEQMPEIDYFIFGHRHLPVDYVLSNGKSRYINTGDWLIFQSYAEMIEGKINVRFYNTDEYEVITNDKNTWFKAFF